MPAITLEARLIVAHSAMLPREEEEKKKKQEDPDGQRQQQQQQNPVEAEVNAQWAPGQQASRP